MSLSSLRKKVNGLLSDESARGAYISIFILYCLYSSVVFLNYQAMSTDDLWFLTAAKHVDIFGAAAAYLNYGAIYWALLKVLTSAFITRLFFLILFLSIPIWIIASLRSEKTKLLVLLFYLTFPFSFWTIKSIGPEILVTFLASAAVFLLSKDKKGSAAFLLGVAAGIKITAAPLIALLVISVVGKNRYFKLVLVLYAFLAGIWLANPFNLFDYIGILKLTSSFQHSMFFLSKTPSFQHSTSFLNKVSFVLTKNVWAGENNRSLSVFIMHPLLITIILLMSIYKIPKIAVPCAIAIVGTGVIVAASPVPYGWYWSTIIPVVLYCAGMLLDSSIKNEAANKIDFAIITITIFVLLANFFLNINNSTSEIGEKAEQIKVIKEFPKSKRCLQKLIDQYQPKYIVDILEFPDPYLFSSGLHAPKGATILFDHNIATPLDPPYSLTGHKLNIPTAPTMLLIDSRMLGKYFILNNMITEKGDFISFYGSCGDFSVFTNSMGRN